MRSVRLLALTLFMGVLPPTRASYLVACRVGEAKRPGPPGGFDDAEAFDDVPLDLAEWVYQEDKAASTLQDVMDTMQTVHGVTWAADMGFTDEQLPGWREAEGYAGLTTSAPAIASQSARGLHAHGTAGLPPVVDGFTPASTFCGGLEGFDFKLGDKGQGYYARTERGASLHPQRQVLTLSTLIRPPLGSIYSPTLPYARAPGRGLDVPGCRMVTDGRAAHRSKLPMHSRSPHRRLSPRDL